MNNFNFNLKRTYSIYQAEKESMVIVSNYRDGIFVGQRNISKREIEFVAKLASKTRNNRNVLVDKESIKKLVQFNTQPFDLRWIVSSMKRNLLVADRNPVSVDVPDLMFHVAEEKLMVYFVRTDKDGDYEIAKCSYPNVFDNYVCLGNIRIAPQQELLSDEMAKWENYFFNSKFTSGYFNMPEVINYQKAKLK